MARRLSVPLDEIVRHVRQRREARSALEATPARLTPSSGDEPYPRRELPAEDTEHTPSHGSALRSVTLSCVLQHLDLSQPLEDLDPALASPLRSASQGPLR